VTVHAAPVDRPAALVAPTLVAHSVRGRRIVARRLGDAGDGPTVLVIGVIHGNEPAGAAIVRRLMGDEASRHVRLWVVSNLNPDGTSAHTRGNAHGVDLNRNFAYRWQPLGSIFYSGPHALSEPESRFARRLITRLRPDITIWFHQAETVVDVSGGSQTIEARFGRRVALPLRRLIRYPGSATTWQTHAFPARTAFVVELPAGWLKARAARAYARAVLDLARGDDDRMLAGKQVSEARGGHEHASEARGGRAPAHGTRDHVPAPARD
jgi:protein MpaA